MNTKITLTLLIAVLTLSSTSCQNQNYDVEISNTTEISIDQTKRDEVMAKFESLDEKTIIDVAEFIDINIDLVTRKDVDDFVLYFIKRSKSDVAEINSDSVDIKLKSIFGINYGPHAVEDGIEYGVSLTRDKKEIALSNLSDDSDKKYITDLFLKGQTTSQYEGEYFLIVDYNYINTKYAGKVSSSLSEYLSIKDTETITPLTNGKYLAVSLDELQNRIISYEIFLKTNSDSRYREDIRNLYSTALWRVLSSHTYFNDFTDDFELKGTRLEYYDTLKNLDTAPIMTFAVTTLYDFFNSDDKGLNDPEVDADKVINNTEKEIHSESMLKIDDYSN